MHACPVLDMIIQAQILFGRWCQIVLILFYIGIGIGLVKDQHAWYITTPQFPECTLHHFDLFLVIRMRDIHYMDQNIGLTDLIQGVQPAFIP